MSDITELYLIRERLARLEEKADHRDDQLDKMDKKLDELRDAFQQAKGAKFVLAGAAAIAGAVGGFLVKLAPFANTLPK